MIWFLERDTNLMICEIRRSPDGPTYEFEVAAGDGPCETMRYESAAELLVEYLRKQSALQAQGWRPKIGAVAVLS